MAKATPKKSLRQQPAFKTLKAMLETPAGARNLLWYYKAGECVEELFPVKGGRLQGKSQMIVIAKALGRPETFESELNYYRKLVLNYEKSEVKKLSDPSNTEHFPISWTHLKWLLSIEDKKERGKFLKKCSEAKMSVDDLRRVIIQTRGRKSKGGKPPVRPKMLDSGLRQMNEECEIWLRKQRLVWLHPDVGVVNESCEQANLQQLPKLLEQAIENFESMKGLIEANLPQLKKMRTSFRKKAAAETKNVEAEAAKAKKSAGRRKTPRKVPKKKR